MSTTPSTTSRAPVSYTVIGGRRWDRIRRYACPLTFLVLSRGDRLFREGLLRELVSLDAGEVLWVGGPAVSHDLETDARSLPEVRFLVLASEASPGERVNIGVSEARSPRVLCLWSDARVSALPPTLLARLENDPSMCLVPVVRNARSEVLPSLQSPAMHRGRLALSWRLPARDGERTLFPFDYCGLYDVARFVRLAGYAAGIVNPYWQKLDFGFRAHLWGEGIRCATALGVTYAASAPPDDATPDAGYKSFWLRNLAVRVRGGVATIPAWRLAEYLVRSDTGPLLAAKEFRTARAWVRDHRQRYRSDPRELIGRWEPA